MFKEFRGPQFERETYIGTLASGEKVIDRKNSHLHDDVKDVLPLLLQKIEANGRRFITEVLNTDQAIMTNCVKTNSNDEIIFIQRDGRKGPTRFVKNREPEPCFMAKVILKKADQTPNTYVLITAFAGDAEPEPWDLHKTERSEYFWSTHALILGSD